MCWLQYKVIHTWKVNLTSENSQTSREKNVQTNNHRVKGWNKVQAAQFEHNLQLLRGVRVFQRRQAWCWDIKAAQEVTRLTVLLSLPGTPLPFAAWQMWREETTWCIWPLGDLHCWSIKRQGSSFKDHRPLWESEEHPVPTANTQIYITSHEISGNPWTYILVYIRSCVSRLRNEKRQRWRKFPVNYINNLPPEDRWNMWNLKKKKSQTQTRSRKVVARSWGWGRGEIGRG